MASAVVPLWDRTNDLFAIRGRQLAHYEAYDLGGTVPGFPSQRYAMLRVSVEEELHRNAGSVWQLVSEYLGLPGGAAWQFQRGAYIDLFQQFFGQNERLPGWIGVIPCRRPFLTSRFRTLSGGMPRSAIAQSVGCARWMCKTRDQRHHRFDLGFRLGELPLRGFVFGHDAEVSEADTRLVSFDRDRAFMLSSAHRARDRVLCLAVPGLDDLSQAQVPAIDAHHDPKVGLNLTPTIVLAKLSHAGQVIQLLATLDPYEGRTVALAPGMRSLETYLRQYPEETSLLGQVVPIE